MVNNEEIITKILVMHREGFEILTNNIDILNDCIRKQNEALGLLNNCTRKQNEALRLLNNKIQELENEIKELKQ